MKTVRRLSQ